MKRAYYLGPLLSMILLLPLFGRTGAGSSGSKADQLKAEDIIHYIDELYRSKSSYSELEMEIVTPHWQRTLVMKAWTLGMNKTFIRILAPKKDEGVATLRIGSEMWNYLPKTNKVIKIPPSMMMSSWMGSDFTNDDLVKEFSLYEDYSYSLIQVPDSQANLLYINCVPREDLPVVWGNIVIAVTEDGYIPVWEKYYDEEGKLMRLLNYSDVRKFGDRTIPATLEMIPVTKENHKTIIRYKALEFDINPDEEIFSLRNLRSKG
jgi:outer membrane lipoprotein-sorting protein